MNVLAIVEKLSLELLIKGKIELKALSPLVRKLRESALDETATRLVDAFEKTLATQSPESHQAALTAIEKLSSHLSAPESGKADSEPGEADIPDDNLLRYDTTHSQEILDSFFSEVSGHLQTVEQNLLHLEKHRADKDALNAVFGAMHSLKGITGFLDVKPAHKLAHVAESLMARARNRDAGIYFEECDVILAAVDSLREIQVLLMAHSLNREQPFPAIPASCVPVCERLTQAVGWISGVTWPAITPIPTIPAGPIAPLGPTENNASTEKTGTRLFVAPGVVHPAIEQRTGMRALEQSGLVRVKVEKLDSLVDAVGEMVVTLTQVQQDPDLNIASGSRLARNMSQLNKFARDLQNVAMSLRMFPLRDTFGRMTRMARDLSHKQGKLVDVVVVGEETELDKNVIELLVDPLTHLIRNAIDHGVDRSEERIACGKAPSAQITFSARHEGSNVIVEVMDDGRGLDLDRIAEIGREKGLLEPGEYPFPARLRELIFEPGFSTNEQVTEVSGRGVGLDVVKHNVESLGGRVSVSSIPGQSTTFTLVLPLTLSIIDGLVVKVGQERYIVPIASVIESLRPVRTQCSTVHGRGEMIEVRGNHLPMIRLSDYAEIKSDIQEPWNAIVMIVECRGERCGLMVDELIGQQQVVIKNLGERLRGIKGICGGAVLGDGRVGLILDVADVLALSRQQVAAV